MRIACALLFLWIGGKAVGNHDASDLANLVELERRDAQAAKINDVETLVSLWTDDGVLLMPGSDPIIGKPAIREILEKQKTQSVAIQTISYNEDWPERHIHGNEAWEWGINLSTNSTAGWPTGFSEGIYDSHPLSATGW